MSWDFSDSKFDIKKFINEEVKFDGESRTVATICIIFQKSLKDAVLKLQSMSQDANQVDGDL